MSPTDRYDEFPEEVADAVCDAITIGYQPGQIDQSFAIAEEQYSIPFSVRMKIIRGTLLLQEAVNEGLIWIESQLEEVN